MGFVDELRTSGCLTPPAAAETSCTSRCKLLLDLEKEVSIFAATTGLPICCPLTNPAQLHGIEINPYAHELARWWCGSATSSGCTITASACRPIRSFKPLHNIQQMDAILGYDEQGTGRAEWPEADVIIGNPPFLGGKKMREEIGGQIRGGLPRAV